MNHTFAANSKLSPLVAVSPHYDDAVFSCGDLLAAYPLSTVITVCTGLPGNVSLLTDWDQRCGFFSVDAAMRARRLENNTSLARLNSQSIELGFLDSQYRQTFSANAELLCDVLSSKLSQLQPATVIFPLGLFHEDHIYISDVLMTLCFSFPAIQWLVYEDIPYRKRPELVQERIVQFTERGFHITPFYLSSVSGSGKEHAVTAYASQSTTAARTALRNASPPNTRTSILSRQNAIWALQAVTWASNVLERLMSPFVMTIRGGNARIVRAYVPAR